MRPVKTANPPENLFLPSPVPAPSHAGSLDREAEFVAMQAKMEALELAEERRQADFEALRSDNERLRGEVSRIPQACSARCYVFFEEVQATHLYNLRGRVHHVFPVVFG